MPLTLDSIMNEAKLAKSLLENREKGITLLKGIKSIKGRLLFRLVIIAAMYFLYRQSGNSDMLILGVGYVLGVTTQDISWFVAIAKRWAFTAKVTDWAKVEDIANENS